MKKTSFILFTSLLVIVFCSFSRGNYSTAAPNKTDSFSLSSGKKVYAEKCSGCHGTSGQGSFGPNLCDNYWIHGAHYHNIVHVIKHGVTAKGMTSFKHKLTHAQVRDVAHYVVLSLKGTNPKNAKGPEGKKH